MIPNSPELAKVLSTDADLAIGLANRVSDTHGEAAAKVATWPQLLSHLSPRFGGIAMSVPQFARATESEASFSCPLIGFCDPAELQDVAVQHVPSTSVMPPQRMRWSIDFALRSHLKKIVRSSEGVHIHGIWEPHCMVGAKFARQGKRPYIISAHGMLDPWALGKKRIKKAIYAALIQTRVLQGAHCLRALTLDEVNDYRRLGLTNPIAIVPNGVEVPSSATPELFLSQHPELAGKRIILFMGRLHPKKGLSILLEAWAKCSRRNSVHLVIAGPDSDGLKATLDRAVEEYNLQDSVSFPGMLAGPQKWSALAASSAFVLPSYSEGFSIAVLEALGMGLPVIVTDACHIPEVASEGCGWVIEPKVEPLARTLQNVIDSPSRSLAETGIRARKLVAKRFTWQVVGNQMAEVYEWVQGGPKPTGVEIA